MENLIFKSEDVSSADFANKLRRENVGSTFLTGWYDDAIIGIDEDSKSIVYSLDKLIELEIALRFEEGGLNDEYDVIDDDILIVAVDSVRKLFLMELDKDEVPPTLFDEIIQSVIYPIASWNCATNEFVFGIEVSRNTKGLNLSSKEFTQAQLEGFISENEAEYLRWIELQQFNPDSTLELVPRELIDFDDEELIIRCVVKLVDEPYWLGFQDLNFDQWELGKVINHEAA